MDKNFIQFPIQAYLSYRSKNQEHIAARNLLKGLCGEHDISLIYDEDELENGDSLIKFMEELTSGRCVFLFLSPDYFQSAYTLFELVKINEWSGLDKRWIIPLRITDEMVTYEWTIAKTYFESSGPDAEKARNELARLLKVPVADGNRLWQRIDEAWQAIVFPYLDDLNPSLASQNMNAALVKLITQAKTAISEDITQSTKQFRGKIIEKITKILQKNRLNAQQLFRDALDLNSEDNVSIAADLVTKNAGEALIVLYRVLTEKKSELKGSNNEWKNCYYDGEQICGWLLLNSIDPDWWFNYELRLEKTLETKITAELPLHNENYVEVIISRSFSQYARYKLDKTGQPIPWRDEDQIVTFDVSADAQEEQVLIQIYKDVLRNDPDKGVNLLDLITNRLINLKASNNKIIYYIVSMESLNRLQNQGWFIGLEKRLANFLQFIACPVLVNPDVPSACLEDQGLLLDKVALILSLEDKKT